MMKNIILILFMLIISSTVLCFDSDPEKYINSLISKEIAILINHNLVYTEKLKQSKKLLKNNIDFDWITKHVLGRYNKDINEENLINFQKVYKKYLILSYFKIIKNFDGKEINKVISSNKNNENQFTVHTVLIKNNAPSTKISYTILYDKKNDRYQVIDLIIEGISLINTQKSEFQNFILNNGFSSLITKLQNKVNYMTK